MISKTKGTMFAFRTSAVALLAAVTLTATSSSLFAANGYSFVEGYNVLDTNNAPFFTGSPGGTNYAGTAAQERDIAVDSARGIIYIPRGTGGVPDGRTGFSGTPVSAFVV